MVFVFKTTVTNIKEILELSDFLNQFKYSKWNFDLEDCDNILRIESKSNIAEEVIIGLNTKGFMCTELE